MKTLYSRETLKDEDLNEHEMSEKLVTLIKAS